MCKLGWGPQVQLRKEAQCNLRIWGRLPLENGVEKTVHLNLKLTFEDSCFYPNAIFGCV